MIAKPKRLRNAASPMGLTDELLALKPSAVSQAFKSEHYGFIFLCIYLLWEYVKPEQQYAIFGILPFLKLSVIGALVGVLSDKGVKFRPHPFQYLLLLFLLHCIVSAAFAYRPNVAFDNIALIYFPVIVYFLITAIVNTERRLFLFVLVYFLANLRMSEYGFLSWARRGFSFAVYGVTGAGWYRNSGEFGMQMSMLFAYTSCFLFFFRNRWQGWVKWLMYFLPLSAVGSVVASSSRGAIVGILAVLFYMSLFSKKKIKAWFGSFLLIGAAYFMMPPEFKARFETAGDDRTSVSRIIYWGNAKIMMAEHPVLGVGFFNWVPYYRDFYYDPTEHPVVELAHNTFLQTGAELGYVGLGLFVAMVLASFVINWKSERLARQSGYEFLRCFAIGMNAAAVGLVVASSFLTATFLPNYWIHFAFTICLKQIIENRLSHEGISPSTLRGVKPRQSKARLSS